MEFSEWQKNYLRGLWMIQVGQCWITWRIVVWLKSHQDRGTQNIVRRTCMKVWEFELEFFRSLIAPDFEIELCACYGKARTKWATKLFWLSIVTVNNSSCNSLIGMKPRRRHTKDSPKYMDGVWKPELRYSMSLIERRFTYWRVVFVLQ